MLCYDLFLSCVEHVETTPAGDSYCHCAVNHVNIIILYLSVTTSGTVCHYFGVSQ